MRDYPSVVNLVRRATTGDNAAWTTVVQRFAPLVCAVCRRHGLTGADAEDIGATVWLRLLCNLPTLREPAALAGWLTTTARRECISLLRRHGGQLSIDEHQICDPTAPELDDGLLIEERRTALRDACARLPDRDRQLLSMVFSDPPTPYTEISASLGMPVGAIGPTRQRCIARLRRNHRLAALICDERAG
jgi:RNA polymerase sigma factor (sigma-70 family)